MTRLEISPATTYAEGLAAGVLRFQRCASCGRAVFYPRVACPHCGGAELGWERSAGRGTVYSTTTTRSRSGDYDVSLIDLDEGFRMMCTVDAPEVRIGDTVEAVFTDGALSFRPAVRS